VKRTEEVAVNIQYSGIYYIQSVQALANSDGKFTPERVIPMPISIKNPETEQLARELAKETGESITEVITNSLKDRLQRVRGRRHARGLPEQVADILERMDALPTLDERSEDEILGYDDRGIPENGGSHGD
jgi:antitoxin VapB